MEKPRRYIITIWGNKSYTGNIHYVDSYEFVPGFFLTTVDNETKAVPADKISNLHITDYGEAD